MSLVSFFMVSGKLVIRFSKTDRVSGYLGCQICLQNVNLTIMSVIKFYAIYLKRCGERVSRFWGQATVASPDHADEQENQTVINKNWKYF